MKVCSVIVTYGDRFHLLKQVIGACYKEGVDKVIVVDNASEQNSRKQLKEYEKENKDRLKVIYLDENTGSAGGYKRGLEEAYQCKECEYIWLLDDDNQPAKNSLNVLKAFWNNIKDDNKRKKVSLLSYRDGREVYLDAINKDYILAGRKNSFLKFHILDLINKVNNFVKRKFKINVKTNNKIKSYGKVDIAYFGGMFFSKELIYEIGYPNENLFVYGDDHDWSYRITEKEGSIYLILNSFIKDIDLSWMNEGNSSTLFYTLLNKGSNFRVYYAVRNGVYFDLKYLVNNRFLYKLNMCIFIFILQFFRNSKNQERYNVFKRAINDALNNRLGKVDI